MFLSLSLSLAGMMCVGCEVHNCILQHSVQINSQFFFSASIRQKREKRNAFTFQSSLPDDACAVLLLCCIQHHFTCIALVGCGWFNCAVYASVCVSVCVCGCC